MPIIRITEIDVKIASKCREENLKKERGFSALMQEINKHNRNTIEQLDEEIQDASNGDIQSDSDATDV